MRIGKWGETSAEFIELGIRSNECGILSDFPVVQSIISHSSLVFPVTLSKYFSYFFLFSIEMHNRITYNIYNNN